MHIGESCAYTVKIILTFWVAISLYYKTYKIANWHYLLDFLVTIRTPWWDGATSSRSNADDGKIGMTPAVELSYLKLDEQRLLIETIDSEAGYTVPFPGAANETPLSRRQAEWCFHARHHDGAKEARKLEPVIANGQNQKVFPALVYTTAHGGNNHQVTGKLDEKTPARSAKIMKYRTWRRIGIFSPDPAFFMPGLWRNYGNQRFQIRTGGCRLPVLHEVHSRALQSEWVFLVERTYWGRCHLVLRSTWRNIFGVNTPTPKSKTGIRLLTLLLERRVSPSTLRSCTSHLRYLL